MEPKVFISYSWTSPEHQALIKSWAEQLMADGVEVVFDLFDLIEGQDKYAFMERMVTDKTVTHVLIFSDQKYSEKADARKDGVGTESQIISEEVYKKVKQAKFIPIICEFDASGTPNLPTFLKSRKWIDFSTPDAAIKNWEHLIRLIYGKPEHEKPKLGKPPIYITSDVNTPTSHIQAKFNSFKQALLLGKVGLPLYRQDLLNACIDYAEELRIRERPDVSTLGERVLEDSKKYKLLRNHIIDWVFFESTVKQNDEFSESIINFLERLRELKSLSPELNPWKNAWEQVHSLFVYETFLYIIAALIKNQSFRVLHEILTTHYIIPQKERYGDSAFVSINVFYCHAESLQHVLAPEGKILYSPTGEYIYKNADRSDLPFKTIIESDLLILLMALIDSKASWFPQILYYSSYAVGDYPLFLRATQHKYFLKLAIVTGIDDANNLRDLVKTGYDRLGVRQWQHFYFHNFWEMMNLDKLDTL